MQVELGLELVAIVGSDFADPERELVDDMIDEVDRVGLSMFFIDLECTDTSGIINGGILKAACLLTLLSNEGQELNVHLDMMTRDLFVVAFGVDFTKARSARQPVQARAFEYPVYCCIGQFDAVIARQIPHDPFGAEVVFAPQIQNLLGDLGRCLVGRVFRNGFGIDQAIFTIAFVS